MTTNDIKYTWEISQIHIVPSLKDQDNVVTKIAFSLHGEYIDVNGTSFKEFWTGVTLIEMDATSTFTPLNEVTQDMAAAWVEASENKKQRNVDWLKNKVLKRLKEKVEPTLIVINSPFGQK